MSKDFGWAIEALKCGCRVRRNGWNGKGQWLEYVTAGGKLMLSDGLYTIEPFIVIKTVDDRVVPWTASQTDALAIDWEYADQ